MNIPNDLWDIANTGAATVAATATKAAGAAGVKHVITQITVSHAAAATAGTPVTFVVRDGATGAGTILFAITLSSPANSSAAQTIRGPWVGSAATAMTVESKDAGAAATIQSVSANGYDIST
jgi:hypothetical protein